MTAWYDDIPALIAFERAARRALGGLQRQDATRPRRLIYVLDVDVPSYDEQRRVRIEFLASAHAHPRVTVDGPEDSPHRYLDGSLCMYHPGDPAQQRWVLSDGLDGLIDIIRVHLFQEEDARHGHGWSGDEAPHGPATRTSPRARAKKPKRRKRRKRR